jgi:hypothetical protein
MAHLKSPDTSDLGKKEVYCCVMCKKIPLGKTTQCTGCDGLYCKGCANIAKNDGNTCKGKKCKS